MLALRQIHSTQHNFVTIQLPKSFTQYDSVEIIILPVETLHKKQLTTQEFLARFAGAIPEFPAVEPLAIQEREME